MNTTTAATTTAAVRIHLLPGHGHHVNNVYTRDAQGFYSNGNGISYALDHYPHVPCVRTGRHDGMDCIADAQDADAQAAEEALEVADSHTQASVTLSLPEVVYGMLRLPRPIANALAGGTVRMIVSRAHETLATFDATRFVTGERATLLHQLEGVDWPLEASVGITAHLTAANGGRLLHVGLED